jgi:hypothetical protein
VLVAALAKAVLAKDGVLPKELLGAYLDIVGEMAMDAPCFWEIKVSCSSKH